MTNDVTVNVEQSLYVIPCGKGYTCYGFDNAFNEVTAIALELGRPDLLPCSPKGSMELWDDLGKAREAARKSNKRMIYSLTPQLMGLEGKRVEVVDCYGNKRRFIVGRSTGYAPCHLEIKRRNSSGGMSVSGAPFKSIKVVP